VAQCLDARCEVGKLRTADWEERSWKETWSSRWAPRGSRNWPCEGGQISGGAGKVQRVPGVFSDGG